MTGRPCGSGSQSSWKLLLPNPTEVTKVTVDDERSARAWGHCTFRGCTATVSCGVNWQLDHVLITCFQNKAHHHQTAPGCDRSAAQDLAATVSHKAPLRGSAELRARMPAVPSCHLPTAKEHKRARRRFLQKQPKRMVATSHGALAWQQRLADRAAFRAPQTTMASCFTLSVIWMMHVCHSEAGLNPQT